ncbi:MAG: DUF333 domain-containing protein [Paracoccaceae bacterium]
MNRVTMVAAVALIVIAGVWFFVSQPGEDLATPDAGEAASAVATMTETEQAAAAFCEAQGGTVETITAAEGKVVMCNLTEGNCVVATRYMLDNRSE